MSRCCLSLLLLLMTGAVAAPASLPAASGESVATAALVDDGILYAASYETVSRAGHLRAVAVNGSRQTRLWDAAERIPPPGETSPPPGAVEVAELAPAFGGNFGQRLVFTNLGAAQGFRLVTFDARATQVLQPLLGLAGSAEATALINAVRGRLGTSSIVPGGNADRPDLLGAVSRSSPVLVGASPVDAATAQRDQVLYVGAEDGLLHAILAGRRTAAGSDYDHAAADCGRELWAYLPGSLLPVLAEGRTDPSGFRSPVHVDGSPVVSELFLDTDGDGRREWRTVLVGTASHGSSNRGMVFALDVTNPQGPRLLWETMLPGCLLGRSRGAAIGGAGGWTGTGPRVFVTAGTAERVNEQGRSDPVAGSYGVLACALDLVDGRLLWRFATACPGAAGTLAEPPTAPTIMTAAASGGVDGVLFGDPAGRLWALDPETGGPIGDRPVWQTPGGVDEPIGGGLAARNRLVLLGSGGVDFADPGRSYAVYAVEILPEAACLLWSLPLAPGEKLWGAPTFDRFGRAYLGLGSVDGSGGRLLVVADDATPAGSVALEGSPDGGLTLASGAVVAISRAGQVELIGELAPESPAEPAAPGRVRIFSWRVR